MGIESASAPRQPTAADVQAFRARERERLRDEYIARISEKDVLLLAASYHNGELCDFFQPPARGSYNMCYFVQFGCQGKAAERWVVRIPLEPCLALGSRNKLEREIATMQLVSEKTTIPVPKVCAFRLGAANDVTPLSSFLILEYIEGEQLDYLKLRRMTNDKRGSMLTSLADIYIQLRRLEFPSSGSLQHHTCGVGVGQTATSLVMNELAIEGPQPSLIQASYCDQNGLLKSADRYVAMLLDMADKAFAVGDIALADDSRCEHWLYYLNLFRKHVESWVDHRLDRGPFTLVHGDLYPHNLLVNEKGTIIGVLDWEWSHVVPRQLFHPPLWLLPENPLTSFLTTPSIYEDYLGQLDQLIAIMRIRERERYGNEVLSDEWVDAKKDGGFLVVAALQDWQYIFSFCHFYVTGPKRRKDTKERVEVFMHQDTDRRALVARKRAEYDRDVAAILRLHGNQLSNGLHEKLQSVSQCAIPI